MRISDWSSDVCSSDLIRVTAQLIDASNGATLWSDRWDRPAGDIFAVQTEVAERVAVALGGMGGSAAITAEELRKARRRSPYSLNAYAHSLLANEGRTLLTGESISRGLAASTQARRAEHRTGKESSS